MMSDQVYEGLLSLSTSLKEHPVQILRHYYKLYVDL